MMVAFSAGDAAYWALAIFLVLLGVGSLVALVKLGRLFDRVSSFVRGTERDLLPVVVKTGGTVDRVNYQLDKLDTVTDSAVSMADSADTAVRAVSTAIATPVEKVSGLAAGIAHGFSSFKKSRNVSDAMDAAKDAARRREQRSGRGPAGRRADAPVDGTPDADSDPHARAEAGPLAEASPDAAPRPGAGPARRASVERRVGPRGRGRASRPDASAAGPGYDRRHAHDRRAPRGLPLVLRVEGPPPAAVSVAGPTRRRPVDAPHERRDAAADAVLPRSRAASRAADHDRAEVLPHARHRGGRPRHLPPDVLRDARQLLVRAVLQGRRDRVRDRVHARPPEARLGRLWVSVHAGDPELGLGPDEVADLPLGSGSGCPRSGSCSFRRRRTSGRSAGPGPCGPDSEIYYDWGEEAGCGEPDCLPGCTRCERFLEFWNLVFMEYELHADRTLTPLPKQNIDTGLGLERTARIVQQVPSVYDTDGYQLIMSWIAEQSGVAYGDSPDRDEGAPDPRRPRPRDDVPRRRRRRSRRTKVAATSCAGSSGGPSTRRAGSGSSDVYRVDGVVADQMGDAYPELRENAREIEDVVRQEEERFTETLERGMKLFEELAGDDGDHRRAGVHARRDLRVPDRAHDRARARSAVRQSTSTAYQREDGRHREISRGTGEKRLLQRAADFARDAGFETDFVGTRRSTCSRRSARSRSSATAPSSRSCASRRSIPPAAARSPTRASSSSTATRRYGRSSSTRTGSTATRRLSSAARALRRATACAPSCPGSSGSRRWPTTRRRTSSRPRCARCSAST